MSHIPRLSNDLSPRPRIRIDEVSSSSTAVDQQSTLPRFCRGSSQRSVIHSYSKPRGRASTDAGRVPAKSQVRRQSTSFGSTQQLEDVYGSVSLQRNDRKVSDCKVQELLKLRKQKLKEAKRKGDEVEILRLKNLNVFDDIERSKSNEDEPKEVAFSEDITGQIDHHEFTSHIDPIDVSCFPRPKSVNQGHTATLCWHLKLEFTQGLAIPNEFSQCTIHPTPSPCAFSGSSALLEPTSPSSLSSRSRHSLRHTKILSVGSTKSRDSSKPCSPSTQSLTAIASEALSPTRQSSITSISNEEDPFLYIAKYIRRRVKGNMYVKDAKRSGLRASNANSKRSSHIKCTCTNHECRTYLLGPPSKHCRSCKLPKLQPEIAAAVDCIEEMKKSILAQGVATLPENVSFEADEYRTIEALQQNIKLVEMYNLELEKRCTYGVWWEGWMVVEDLRRRGIVGSKQNVIGGDNAIA